MAGLKHYKMAIDPALVRLANMNANRHVYFRWTGRTARLTFIYVAVVPSLLGYLAYTTDGKYNFRAKLRGDSMLEY